MLSHGTSTRTPVHGSSAPPSFELAGMAFIAGYSNEHTRRSYTGHLRDWFAFAAEHQFDPMEAQRFHVELWVRSLEARKLRPRTVSIKVATVRSFYRYCVEEDWLVVSPADRVKGPTVERLSPKVPLTRTQLCDLVDAASALGPDPRALVMLLGFNGLRIGETCAANVEDLTEVRLSPVLWLPRRKGGKVGWADLAKPTEMAVRACVAGRSEGPLLRNQAGNRMTRENAHRILKRCRPALRGNVPTLSPHTLRHTWTTIAVDAGVNTDRIQQDGGWSDARMRKYYTHTQHNPLGATTHLVAAHVMSAA